MQFLFGTSSGAWCFLYKSYVEARGLPIYLDDEGQERARVGEIGVFGRTWQPTGVAFGDEVGRWEPPLAGRFGAYCLWESVVAIDASVPVIAVASAGQRPTLAGAECRLPLIPNTWKGTCFTAAVSGAVFRIGYEYQSSVTPEYLATRRTRAGRNGRATITFELPGEIRVTQEVGVSGAGSLKPLEDTGITRCDGVLGADFWCRWVTGFDFAAGELLLFPYD